MLYIQQLVDQKVRGLITGSGQIKHLNIEIHIFPGSHLALRDTVKQKQTSLCFFVNTTKFL